MAKKKKQNWSASDLSRVLGDGLQDIMSNVIWQNEAGVYEVFAAYSIVTNDRSYTVYRGKTLVGVFYSTRTALGWCIADKYKKPRLSKELITLDNQLQRLKDDIEARTSAARRSADPNFRESVFTKLETKIIRQKQIEFEINKCITTARQCQNQGFNNETTRTGRKTSNR